MGRNIDDPNYGDHRSASGLSLREGDNYVRVVRNAVANSVVHWVKDAGEGKSARICCPAGYRKRGFSDTCPACQEARREREDGVLSDDQRVSWQRKFYLAVVGVTPQRKKRWKKGKDGERVAVMKDGKQATKRAWIYNETIELLGGRDGIGPQIWESIADFGADEAYGNPTNWVMKIVRKGSGRLTKYTVTAIPPAESGPSPDVEQFNDPGDLLGDGLAQFEDPTPIGEIYRALGIEEGLEAEVDVDGAFGGEEEAEVVEVEEDDEEEEVEEDDEEEEVEEDDEEEEVEEDEDEEVEEDEEEEVEDDEEEEESAEVTESPAKPKPKAKAKAKAKKSVGEDDSF